ncbi:MetQ/NlpA family ABC transporter substrate-binding protein [Corynebacterium pyruviciproducens]|uniref:MetQ/NlpA family ABC transporter substrate-binding protein n=1 Tax=Corynebacterium pyruviciproducens TaxID=598660 RepID=A0AAF1BR85_9CORY|nr:MetQ/NlpA family ABC transporter substrate-binding protein [Corynebacterium pyruviciproducens]MDK7213314.1 MetQ/NlpA family ABC transporter substrate-binding protein [Corynebacterium pyruviciproducens]WOT01518.1 MetQ/NlpA family ABC transporter substrate-binding protein [Corynebacterium pyruviciproducens]
MLKKLTALAVAAVVAGTGLTACGNQESADSATETVRIGTTDGSKKAWKVFEDKAKEQGIKLDIQNFGDYSTPNTALSEDQLDVNLFQHIKFLAEYNVGADDNLTPVGSSEIVPLAIFWKDHTSLDGIDGEGVAIPNDPSNQGRAINVLVQAGLVKLKTDGLITPTPADIDQAASKVKVQPVDAAQTTAAYGEGKPAVINNSFLDRAGIDPTTSVFQDDPESTEAEPYINVFVTKAEKKDDPTIQKLVKIWHDPEVTAAVADDSNDTSVPVDRPAAELQEILDRLEADQKAAK